MKKIICLSLIVLLTTVILTGCNEKVEQQSNPQQNQVQMKQRDNEQSTISNEREDNQADSSQQPHKFGGFEAAGQEFTGGSTVSEYNLSSVRRVPHPEFIRLVFEFTKGDSGESGEAPPDYKVRLEKDSQNINITLHGVTKADIMKNKQKVLSLSKLIKDIKFTPKEGSGGIVNLELSGPVTFQVFDLGDPARLVVVLKSEGGQDNQL